ncbi:DUF3857 domain-containing protein [Chitinophaga qingshengii]|uniref:DUF3857 domain-containing protein n=1 Tax=Chitinophaga qingshengii TaxID=1569794 RepID=A0ABR7TKU7_9BACT|nr:DUF3857 domain-containing protein [Chitinophaga qingshengii]MBC9929679.1 DUF3857 domain-containing protein [Chitinophaga qingshengii]
MYKLLSSLVLATLCSTRLMAGDPVYPVKAIPDSIMKNAHLVKRFEEVNQTIVSPREVIVVSRFVLTVLDQTGAEETTMKAAYNKLTEIRSMSGALYDAEGKLIRRMKQSDIKDRSMVGDGNLMTDTRYKEHRFYHNIYPYTIEYELEERHRSAFYLESWLPQPQDDYTVEQSKFTLTAPADFKVRFLETGCKVQQTTNEKGKVTYTWEVKNLPAYKAEPYSKGFTQLSTNVQLGPTAFKLDDYEGDASTWEGLGKFVYALNAGRDELPDNMRQKVQELTAGLTTNEQKIRVLYKWLQQNYRYISIQLGIGGMQTFDAKTVAAKGYGDCKALSNYMMAMLKEAGVKSYCALVSAGPKARYVNEQFPKNYFNHMILCVPGKDTTWLECTSPTTSMGYLSSFTSNRAVLLITEEGGKLVHTPTLTMQQNRQHRTINAVMQDNGDLKLSATTTRTGEEQDDLHDVLHAYSKDKQLERIRRTLELASYDVSKYECLEKSSLIPEIDEQLEISSNAYGSVTGKRIFVRPNILNHEIGKLEQDSSRVSDVVLKYAFSHVDSVSITVPAGYKAESVPAPVALQTKFGNYSAITAMKGNTITYIRRLEGNAGTFPASEYNEFAKFCTAIYRADRNRMVLVKE